MRRALLITDSTVWTAESEYAAAVARAERGTGFEVVVVAPSGSPVFEAVGDAKTVELPGRVPGRSPADFIVDQRTVSNLVRSMRFDVVQSSRSAAHAVLASAVGRRAPVVHLRGTAQRPSTHILNRFLYRRLTDAVIVSSERIRSWVVDDLGVPSARVKRVLAPVDAARFAAGQGVGEARRTLGWPLEAPVVVDVGRLAPIKGQRILLEAMAEVLKRFPGARLVLVGEPWRGQRESLESLATELGIAGSVVFAGRQDDVGPFIAGASVCVSSSVGSEENSRVISEYLAAGRPVVATAVGVVPELIREGETGWLLSPNDPSALASGIAAALSDPAEATRRADNGRRFALAELSYEAFDHGICEVLSSVGVCP